MSKKSLVLAAFLMFVISGPAVAAPLRVGLVYREGPSGHRMVQGIEEALEKWGPVAGKNPVAPLRTFPYAYEEAGLRAMRDALDSGEVDVILGPTDSGVFLDLQEFEDTLEEKGVVVLSPLVTADVGNVRDGWLFRTNVKVDLRARKVYDELARRGYRQITVLYESTGFGDRAEKAFRDLLGPGQESRYTALRYRDPAGIRDAAQKIIEKRPGAVGLFGRREHIRTLRTEIQEVAHGWVPYDPQLFTIVDARTLCQDGVFFVSLVGPSTVDCIEAPRLMSDEINGLGYDTATFLLRVASLVDGDPASSSWRTRFRDRLAGTMEQPGKALPRTKMTFSGMENRARPKILVSTDGEVAGIGEGPGWFMSRVQIRQRRFGLTPLFNMALVVGIVAFLSFLDVRKAHTGPWWRFVWRWTFLQLLLFNMLVAAVVFFFLAEFTAARWDNMAVALTVAFGYRMMLKSTIFETKAGQAVGLAHYYDRAVQSINRRLMVLRYELEAPRIYYLSYTNSRSWLRQVLRRVYAESEDPDKAEQLLEQAEKAVEKETEEIARRRIYARILLDLLNWRQIVRSRLVPPGMREFRLYDPATVLREAAEYSTNHQPGNNSRIRGMVRSHLRRLEKRAQRAGDPNAAADYKAASNALHLRVAEATSERGRVYFRLEWLVVQQAMSVDQIWSSKFVEPDYNPLTWRGRLNAWAFERFGLDKPVTMSEQCALERRFARRVPLDSGVTMKVLSDDGAAGLDGVLADVGTGGACLFTDHGTLGAERAEHHQLELRVVDGPLAELELEGHCREVSDEDGRWRMHVEWTDISDDAKTKIEELVCHA